VDDIVAGGFEGVEAGGGVRIKQYGGDPVPASVEGEGEDWFPGDGSLRRICGDLKPAIELVNPDSATGIFRLR